VEQKEILAAEEREATMKAAVVLVRSRLDRVREERLRAAVGRWGIFVLEMKRQEWVELADLREVQLLQEGRVKDEEVELRAAGVVVKHNLVRRRDGMLRSGFGRWLVMVGEERQREALELEQTRLKDVAAEEKSRGHEEMRTYVRLVIRHRLERLKEEHMYHAMGLWHTWVLTERENEIMERAEARELEVAEREEMRQRELAAEEMAREQEESRR
jgi:hypothetical protein